METSRPSLSTDSHLAGSLHTPTRSHTPNLLSIRRLFISLSTSSSISSSSSLLLTSLGKKKFQISCKNTSVLLFSSSRFNPAKNDFKGPIIRYFIKTHTKKILKIEKCSVKLSVQVYHGTDHWCNLICGLEWTRKYFLFNHWTGWSLAGKYNSVIALWNQQTTTTPVQPSVLSCAEILFNCYNVSRTPWPHSLFSDKAVLLPAGEWLPQRGRLGLGLVESKDLGKDSVSHGDTPHQCCDNGRGTPDTLSKVLICKQ